KITVTVQNRGGIAQTSILIDAISLDSLPAGYITTVAGGTTYAGDGKLATSASLFQTFQIALDSSGNTFIADTVNNRLRKVSAATGVVTTVAGTGAPGSSIDGILATSANLILPFGVAVDESGSLYISSGSAVMRVNAATGIISTY